MINYSSKKGHIITVYSTLIGLSIEKLEKLKEIDISEFIIHLPTLNYLENIKVNENYLQMLEFTKKCISNSTFIVMVKEPQILELDNRIKDILHDITIQSELINSRAGNLNNVTVNRKNGIIHCDRNFQSHVLLPNGEISLCCQDFNYQYVIADLNKDKYMDIYNNKALNEFKTKLKDETADLLCRFCEYAIHS